MEPQAAQTAPPRAALIVIGNEILSGKVPEANANYLARELFEMGWELLEIAVVADCRSAIAETVQRLHPRVDHLFTSGGVGPTHDDVTLAALSQATGRPITVSPLLEQILKNYYGVADLSPAQQRLSLILEGATLHYGSTAIYPQLIVDGIYPLPGVPTLFRQKFQELKELWPVEHSKLRRCFHLVAEETELADLLANVAASYPDVQLGSYPTCIDGVWNLELVLESRNQRQMTAAVEELSSALATAPSPVE